MPEAKTGDQLNTLQAGRAAAAMAVVLFHLSVSIFGLPKYFPNELFVPFRIGHTGVDFFFVLSGFLMTWLYGDRLGDTRMAGRFLWKRALRVYPPYLVAVVPLIPVYFLMPGLGDARTTDPGYIAASLLLLPTQGLPLLSVAWTLQFEMFFYLVFAGLIAFPRLFKPLILLWAAAAVSRLFLPDPPFPLSFVTSPWILLFLYGAVAARVARRGVSWPMLWLAAGAALFAGAAVADEFSTLAEGLTRNGTGLGAALMVIGMVTAERAGRIRVPRWLVYSGDFSYALYLVHTTVLSLGVKIIFALGLQGLPRLAIAVALVAACVAVAILLHEIVEKRLMRLRPKRSGPNLGAVAAEDEGGKPLSA